MDKVGLEVMELCKSIKKQPIVQDISFRITSGQVLALCGGNGAGKSTVLRMIAGILRPTSGEAVVNNVRWLKERKRYSQQIGYMPDDYQFNQGLTAEEVLLFWASKESSQGESTGSTDHGRVGGSKEQTGYDLLQRHAPTCVICPSCTVQTSTAHHG